MKILQTFRENWDAAFVVVAIGLILGWALAVIVVLPALE